MLARALWMQGFTEQAINEARLSQEELQGKDQQLLLCRTLYHGICRIAPMTGDFATADREITRLNEAATGLNAHVWETAGHFLKGKLLVERGEFAQGLLVLRDAFETCDRDRVAHIVCGVQGRSRVRACRDRAARRGSRCRGRRDGGRPRGRGRARVVCP